MKTLKSKSICRMCRKTGFTVENTFGGVNCPICNCMVEKESTFTDDDWKVIIEYFKKRVNKHKDDKDDEFEFCPKCKIVFGWRNSEHGVEQWEHGDTIYNGLLVEGFMYKGGYYKGMPLFDSGDELIKLLKNEKFSVVDYMNPNEGVKMCIRSDVVVIKELESIPWGKYN